MKIKLLVLSVSLLLSSPMSLQAQEMDCERDRIQCLNLCETINGEGDYVSCWQMCQKAYVDCGLYNFCIKSNRVNNLKDLKDRALACLRKMANQTLNY